MPDGLIAHIWYITFLACLFTLLGFIAGFSLGEQNASNRPRHIQGDEE